MHATRLITANTSGSVDLDRLLPDATRTGAGNVFANSCTSDWQQVEPGDVYVALPELTGNEENGHHVSLEAVARGAIAVICEEPVPVFDVPTYLVSDSRSCLMASCARHSRIILANRLQSSLSPAPMANRPSLPCWIPSSRWLASTVARLAGSVATMACHTRLVLRSLRQQNSLPD